MFERIVSDKGFTLITKTISPEGDVTFGTQEFTLQGVPVSSSQEGSWNERWNVFETAYGTGGTVQTINGEVTKSKHGAKQFVNPTVLWFWQTHPKVGTSVTVDFLAQNTIATFKIKFTYEGDDKMKVQGREVVLHRVHERPLSARDGVYTVWWYDDNGMGVKRYHKTTEHEFRAELASWR